MPAGAYMRDVVDKMATAILPKDKPVSTEWYLTGLIVLSAVLSVLGLFWATVRSMVDVWESSRTFAHGFLVLPAAAYLVWCHRNTLLLLVPAPSAWGMGALILTETGWIMGYRLDLIWLQQAAVVGSLPALVWALLGTKIAQILAWPLGFLVFMLPVGTSLERWLQDFTVWFILAGLQLTGVPYLYENYRIAIPSGTWEVAPDCGGLRYLLPGLALGYAFAALAYRKPARRIAFLVVCAAMLMVANGVRAYGVIVGDHFGVAEGTDHRVFSYAVYGLTIPLLYWLGSKWTERRPCGLPPDQAPHEHPPHDVQMTIVIAIAAVALLALAPLSVWLWLAPR
jgi:exosortase A